MVEQTTESTVSKPTPWWLKWLVIAWLPVLMALLWITEQYHLSDYIELDKHQDYSDGEWVQQSLASWIGEQPTSDQLTVWHVYEEGCVCNQLVEKHIKNLSLIQGISINRIKSSEISLDSPATPTLIASKGNQPIFFGAYGSGILCQNDALTPWFRKQKLAREVEFLANTMTRGCFCTNKPR
ncbi:MAG: hypothetical protein V2I33_03205 [Kangiellaceae bacterium]|jgi:hypothetical protein|nr:hypothetical protein [Kangiellaceae bacterium]